MLLMKLFTYEHEQFILKSNDFFDFMKNQDFGF